MGRLASGNKANQELLGKIPGFLAKLVEMLPWDPKGAFGTYFYFLMNVLGCDIATAVQNSIGRVEDNRRQLVEANAIPLIWEFFLETKTIITDMGTSTCCQSCLALSALNSLIMSFPDEVSSVVDANEIVKRFDDNLLDKLLFAEVMAMQSLMNRLAEYDPSKGSDPTVRAKWVAKVKIMSQCSTAVDLHFSKYSQSSLSLCPWRRISQHEFQPQLLFHFHS